jgi:uncharacterized protein (TIGR02996 family)
MIADSQTAGALLEYICRHPGEDDVRIVYADWLDDHGTAEDQSRAAFIRGQIETGEVRDDWNVGAALILTTGVADSRGLLGVGKAVVRRGFIAEVSLTAEAFAGGPCGRCQQRGWDWVAEEPEGGTRTMRRGRDCPVCHGKGVLPGYAAALFRAAPIEAVKLDREPDRHGRGYAWYYCDRDVPPWAAASGLPTDLFGLLCGGVAGADRWIIYPTHQHALDALAAACLLYGRSQGWPCPECKGKGVWCGGSVPRTCWACRGTGHTVETPA